MTVNTTDEVRLVRRPRGALDVSDLEVVTVPVPSLRRGQVLVRNVYHSVDAAIRIRLQEITPPGYLAAIPLGGGLEGLAVGFVTESRHAEFAPGDLVQHAGGYRELSVVDASDAALGGAGRLTRLDESLAPPEVHLALLGATGLTAWAGVVAVARASAGEAIWVSAAAGAVGSVAVQLAQARGCRVIGSAGNTTKVAHLRDEFNVAAAFSHHDDLASALASAAPDGIDIYFDNVGGRHLEIALEQMRPFGRVALCGSISEYDGQGASSVRNLFLATAKNLTLRGFRAGAFANRADEASAELVARWHDGTLRLTTSVYDGLARAPHAIVDLLAGRTVGKCLIATP